MNEVDTQFDRLPPHSIEAERCLIGSMMLDKGVITEVAACVSREAFYLSDHQIYFDVILDLHRKDRAIDAVIVREEITKRQLWEEVGGNDYLATVLHAVPSAAHAMHYAGIVREKHIGRSLIAIANEALRAAYLPYADDGYFHGLVMSLERKAAALAVRGTLPKITMLADAIQELYEEKAAGTVRRQPTYISDLDDMIGGGVPVGGWTLVAGKPGMGKSQLGKQILLNCSEQKVPCGLITIEEQKRKVAANMIANLMDVNNDHITCAKWEKNDFEIAAKAWKRTQAFPYHIEDSSETISELQSVVTLMAVKHECKLVVIDHIHIADAELHGNKSREQQIATMSKTLKMLAKKLDIALIGLCQLNRGGGDREHSRPPILSDLRDSGSLEADGDLILMLHRPDYYKETEPGYQKTNKLECYVNKQKDGPKAVVPLYFDGDHQRISRWENYNAFDSSYPNVRPHVPATNNIDFGD